MENPQIRIRIVKTKDAICYLFNVPNVPKSTQVAAVPSVMIFIIFPEEKQKELRKGKQNGVMVFNKSRRRKKSDTLLKKYTA